MHRVIQLSTPHLSYKSDVTSVVHPAIINVTKFFSLTCHSLHSPRLSSAGTVVC